jgi:hypothetical protein
MTSTSIISPPASVDHGLIFEPDATVYCEKHNMVGLVELAAQIISRHFSLAGPILVELQMDPDADEENPLLVFPVAATIDETERQSAKYVEEWIKSVPAEMRLRVPIFPNIVGTANGPSRIPRAVDRTGETQQRSQPAVGN